jgi:flagellar protein FlgJ
MRIDHLHTGVGAAHPQPNAKLVDGAHQFEAMMLQEMLKPLKFGSTDDTTDGEESGGASDTIRGMGVEAVSKAIASTGGFGLAKQIIQQVTAEQKAQHGEKQDEV